MIYLIHCQLYRSPDPGDLGSVCLTWGFGYKIRTQELAINRWYNELNKARCSRTYRLSLTKDGWLIIDQKLWWHQDACTRASTNDSNNRSHILYNVHRLPSADYPFPSYVWVCVSNLHHWSNLAVQNFESCEQSCILSGDSGSEFEELIGWSDRGSYNQGMSYRGMDMGSDN